MIIRNKHLYKYLLVCLFSFFYVLGFAPFNFFFLGVLAIVGISFIFKRASNKKELVSLTLLSSLVISIFGMYWLVYAANYTFESKFLGVLVLIGFSFLYSVFMFMVSIPIYLANKNRKFYFFVLVIAWSAMDCFKFYFLGGFPWFLSAYLWSETLPIIQIVSVIGVVGLSVFTYALVFSLYVLFNGNISKSFRFNTLFIFIIAFAGFYFYGQARINYLNILPAEKTLKVRLVQTNISQATKLKSNTSEIIADSVLPQISLDIEKANPQMIFLPETSFIFFNEKYFNNKITQTPNIPLVVGVLRLDVENHAYNSVFNIQNRKVIDYYDKIRLVPFGERIPFSDYFPSILNFVGLENLTAGEEVRIFTIGDYKLVPTVCFEGLFPLENITANDVDFILNTANEAWFNQSIELDQNWDIYKFRSIETGVPSLKVANTGISGAYDLKGDILFEVEPFIKINADMIFPIKKTTTVFSKINYHNINYGIFILYVIMLSLVFLRKNIV